MNPLLQFFNIVLYQPLLNLLVLLYTFLPGQDFGLSIIVLTLLIKLLLFPSSRKSIQSQKALQALQPKIKEIQEKFKADKIQQTQALMELYKKEKITPMSGCLPLLLQLPILIALYQVFLTGLQPERLKGALYKFVPFPEVLSTDFLGIMDLARPFYQTLDGKTVYYFPALVLALLAGIVQFWQSKTLAVKPKVKAQRTGRPDFSQTMQSQMLYFFPLLTVGIILKFGSIIGLYWLASSAFSIVEQRIVNMKSKMQSPGIS